MKILIIDLFSGAGGVSTGFAMAKDCKVIAAVNHDDMAIQSHTANHPDVIHFVEDIKHIQMEKLVKIASDAKTQHPGALLLLWASLECTNFSKAKGGLPRDADSRSLADYMPWYVESLKPDYIGIENVIEFMSWGPLDENGKPERRKNVGKFITYNGSGISDVADFTHQSRYEAPKLIKVKMFNRNTSAAILLIPC